MLVTPVQTLFYEHTYLALTYPDGNKLQNFEYSCESTGVFSSRKRLVKGIYIATRV